MRKLFLTFSLALITFAASAIPAMKGLWKTVKLANGREIQVELRGDEFLSYWQAADGTKYVNNPNSGFFEVADFDQLLANADAMRSVVNEDRALRAPAKRTTIGDESSSYKGEKKGIIILVQFADLAFQSSNTPELYNRIANEENFTSDLGFVGSVKDYFKAQSYGQFVIDFDVVGPVTMSNGYAYYGERVSTTINDNYEHIGEMIMDACKAVDDQVNFADYDWDGDGNVDQVFILYAGEGEASGGDANTIWPHEYTLRGACGQSLTLDGVTINTYACSNEIKSDKNNSIDGIGAFCHEFSHCLGLPDMYDTQGSNYGMGTWDLLDSGSYNGNSFVPAAYTSYERMFCDWITPTELSSDCQISNMQSLSDSGEAYIMYNDRVKTEYYLLENRTKTGWDASLSGSGLLVLHVDFNSSYWSQNMVNVGSIQHCTVIPANNNQDLSKESGHPYPYSTNNSLTNTSTPAATLNNTNTDGKKFMNKALTNITKNSDGTISFYFENNNQNSSDFVAPNSYIFYESFNSCDGAGGNDGVFTGSVGAGTFKGYTDNDGWSSISGHGAFQCAMFGSTTSTGTVTMPEVTCDGDCYLLFKAAPYTGDGTNLGIEVYSGDVSLSKSAFVLTEGEWTACNAKITGSGAFKIRFTPTKRFFLDEVYVTYEDVTGIENITVDRKSALNGKIFSIDGRYVGNDFNSLNKGIYIVNGKKVVK
ncbi:MAG: M6 family metalloprotease domain-containing protein [Prevotella sp.]|nr:M6 family metalloprotease domain-containing protein [Prevotella sp.]